MIYYPPRKMFIVDSLKKDANGRYAILKGKDILYDKSPNKDSAVAHAWILEEELRERGYA